MRGLRQVGVATLADVVPHRGERRVRARLEGLDQRQVGALDGVSGPVPRQVVGEGDQPAGPLLQVMSNMSSSAGLPDASTTARWIVMLAS